MFSTDNDKPPKRAIVTSLAGALGEIQRWQTENQLDQVRDGDGLAWRLDVRADVVPDLTDPRKMQWQVKVKLTSKATGEALVATGALDPVKDARLLQMMGDSAIDLAMKPLVYRVASEEAARSIVVDVLPQLKASFLKNSLSEVKRQLIGRWVDDRQSFGAMGEPGIKRKTS